MYRARYRRSLLAVFYRGQNGRAFYNSFYSSTLSHVRESLVILISTLLFYNPSYNTVLAFKLQILPTVSVRFLYGMLGELTLRSYNATHPVPLSRSRKAWNCLKDASILSSTRSSSKTVLARPDKTNTQVRQFLALCSYYDCNLLY